MDKVTIYLGSQCNLSCRYCHREGDSERYVSEKLIQLLREKPHRIRFIGGEPTLYMGTIKRIVRALPKNTRYFITTNGKNFPKYRSFFLKHRFIVCISYDGNNSLRGYDPFTKSLDYPWLAVSCTLFHGNTDFDEIFRKFSEKEKITGAWLSFFPHIMHVTSPGNAPYALTIEDMNHIYHQWKGCLERLVEEYEEYGVVNRRYLGLLVGLLYRDYDWGETYCHNRYAKKVDLKGDSYTCLYIRDTPPVNQKDYMERHFLGCKGCPVYSFCGGACIKSVQHERECYFYRRLFSWFKGYKSLHGEAIRQLEVERQ